MSPFPDREALLDLVADLQHDLGKHVLLPVSMLRPGAGPCDVRAALEAALTRTRASAARTRGAREIWDAFVAESGGAFAGSGAFARLERAVERALALEGLLRAEGEAAREDVERDLAAVGTAIRELREEVTRGA
jgi:hypothetical protein